MESTVTVKKSHFDGGVHSVVMTWGDCTANSIVITLDLHDTCRRLRRSVPHGAGSESGEVQSLLERRGLSYLGSRPDASALAFDKHETKTAVRAAGLRTPEWDLLRPETASPLRFSPAVMKPRGQGSSIGVQLVRNPQNARSAVSTALRYDKAALVEAFISGHDVTVGIMGNQVLHPIEVQTGGDLFSYSKKYTDSDCGAAPIQRGRLCREVRRTAFAVHQALGLRHLSRIDFRVDPSEHIWFLEANTLPGLTEKSLYPQSAAAAGIGFEGLLDRLCRMVHAEAPIQVRREA